MPSASVHQTITEALRWLKQSVSLTHGRLPHKHRAVSGSGTWQACDTSMGADKLLLALMLVGRRGLCCAPGWAG